MDNVMQELERYSPEERHWAEQQRATRLQFVSAEYEIAEGHVQAVLPPFRARRLYFPMGSPNMLSEFAGISPGDERKCLRFVRRWGLLGYDVLAGNSQLVGDRDPLDWIWAHANGVRAVLALTRVLADEDGTVAYLDRLRGLAVGQGKHIIEWPEVEPGVTPWTVLEYIVNSNLKGFYLQVSKGAPSREALGTGAPYHLVFHWDALINVIYRHLADVMAGSTIRICGSCSWPFVPTHARQRFCPAGPGGRSLCEQRFTKARRRRGGKKS